MILRLVIYYTFFIMTAMPVNAAQLQTLGGEVSVILLHGQSNVVGCGRDSEMAHTTVPPHIDFYNTGVDLYAEGGWGPEQGLFNTLPNDRRWVIIKHAVGGTLLEWWLPGTDIYSNMTHAVELILSRYSSYCIKAVYMGIGESDSARDTAYEFYDNLKRFAWYYRNRLGSYPEAKFVIGQTTRWNAEYIDVVRSAQEQASIDIVNATLLDLNGLGKRPDGIHHTSEATLELGGLIYGEVN